jgi:hypothetical protein
MTWGRRKPDALDFKQVCKYLTKDIAGRYVSPIYFDYDWQVGRWQVPDGEPDWRTENEEKRPAWCLAGGAIHMTTFDHAYGQAVEGEYIGIFNVRGFIAGGLYDSAWSEAQLVEVWKKVEGYRKIALIENVIREDGWAHLVQVSSLPPDTYHGAMIDRRRSIPLYKKSGPKKLKKT